MNVQAHCKSLNPSTTTYVLHRPYETDSRITVFYTCVQTCTFYTKGYELVCAAGVDVENLPDSKMVGVGALLDGEMATSTHSILQVSAHNGGGHVLGYHYLLCTNESSCQQMLIGVMQVLLLSPPLSFPPSIILLCDVQCQGVGWHSVQMCWCGLFALALLVTSSSRPIKQANQLVS